MASIDSLPEELLVEILEYLDAPPPSQLKSRDEPSLTLTDSYYHPLKNISQASKRSRRIALPVLFRRARICLGSLPRDEWKACRICGSDRDNDQALDRLGDTFTPAEKCHRDMTNDVCRRLKVSHVSQIPRPPLSAADLHPVNEFEAERAISALEFYHVADDFLAFLGAARLLECLQSVVVLSDQQMHFAEEDFRFPHQDRREWRYVAAAMLWQQLLSSIDPNRITVVAAPIDLAVLMNTAIDTFGEWAFSDMDLHIVELEQDVSGSSTRPTPSAAYAALDSRPHAECSGIAPSSALALRNWTHLRLNEGSFLKAYGTYEYFERGPASLVRSIKAALHPHPSAPSMPETAYPLHALRHFTYTAIFPFAAHADFNALIPHLSTLDLQLAPDPASGILDSKARTGKADMSDCWQEIVAAYQEIGATLASWRMDAVSAPRLERFMCRDVRIEMLKEELDLLFVGLRLPVWVETVPGGFERVAVDARLEGVEGVEVVEGVEGMEGW